MDPLTKTGVQFNGICIKGATRFHLLIHLPFIASGISSQIRVARLTPLRAALEKMETAQQSRQI